MMKIEQPELDEACLDGANSPSAEARKSSISIRGLGRRGSTSSSLGQVLIISEDAMVRDFLGQMLGLLGYDNQSCREWRFMEIEQSWRGYDAVFLESHFLNRFRNLKGAGEWHSQDHPMVVVLAPENGEDLPSNQELGMFRVLRKPLDYRQMGKIMDECFQLKMQAQASQGLEESGD